MNKNMYDIVLELNQEYYHSTGDDEFTPFTFLSNGYVDIIEFFGAPVWDSENDSKFDDNDNPIDIKVVVKTRALRSAELVHEFLKKK
jgi:hypothetical protein